MTRVGAPAPGFEGQAKRQRTSRGQRPRLQPLAILL